MFDSMTIDTQQKIQQVDAKRENFIRLGNKRLQAALNSIRLLENLLQNPYAYQYDGKDIEILVQRLETATTRLKLYWKAPYDLRN